jgi:hypothetical protein
MKARRSSSTITIPANNQFAGGIGYLTDGQETLSTLYAGNSETFDRVFGIGYFRKRVAGKNLHADQVISAPFGDDPVLLSQVTITNHGQSASSLRWIEYWGCQNYQFSFRSFIESFTGQSTPADSAANSRSAFKAASKLSMETSA